MYNKKPYIAIVCLIFLMVIVPMVSAKDPKTSTGENNLEIKIPDRDFFAIGEVYEFAFHVSNQENGVALTSTDTFFCDFHLYGSGGNHIWTSRQTQADLQHLYDLEFVPNANNFSERGEYYFNMYCECDDCSIIADFNDLGGFSENGLFVNGFGEELTEANASMFNYSMMFLMILFVLTLVGLFMVEHYIGKFALYWIAHLLFVIGTFSMWQFNWGYAISYTGLAGIWKVLFYVSTIAVLPMILLSMVWIFYIHAFNEHFQKLVDKGEDTETAFAMANKKSKGWLGGR